MAEGSKDRDRNTYYRGRDLGPILLDIALSLDHEVAMKRVVLPAQRWRDENPPT